MISDAAIKAGCSVRTSLPVLVLGLMTMLESSCALFAPGGAGVATLGIEELRNGYLVSITTENPVGDVTAVLGPSNWLLITIADSTVDAGGIGLYQGSLVDSVEISSFSTAVQISLHLTKPIDALEVIHQNPGTHIQISLFLRKND